MSFTYLNSSNGYVYNGTKPKFLRKALYSSLISSCTTLSPTPPAPPACLPSLNTTYLFLLSGLCSFAYWMGLSTSATSQGRPSRPFQHLTQFLIPSGCLRSRHSTCLYPNVSLFLWLFSPFTIVKASAGTGTFILLTTPSLAPRTAPCTEKVLKTM